MAKFVSQYRLVASTLADFVGEVGQIVINLTRNSVTVMDGVTPGGYEQARADASNLQPATASQDGKMTQAQVTELTAATAAIAVLDTRADTHDTDLATLDAALDALTTVVAGKTAKVVPAATSNIAVLAADGALVDLGMPFFAAGTVLSFMNNSLPTGWTLNTSHNDRVPLFTSTLSEGDDQGGSWTISGLTHAHTHTFSDTGTTAASNGPDQNLNGGGAASPQSAHTHDFAVSGTTSGASTSAVSSGSSWRPAYTKMVLASRNAGP